MSASQPISATYDQLKTYSITVEIKVSNSLTIKDFCQFWLEYVLNLIRVAIKQNVDVRLEVIFYSQAKNIQD